MVMNCAVIKVGRLKITFLKEWYRIIGILHEGGEQSSVLHEAGQTWLTNPKGEFTRFDQSECNTLLRSAPEYCIPFITCRVSCNLVQFWERAMRRKILNSTIDQ